MRSLRPAAVLVVLLAAASPNRAEWAWKSPFTDASAPALVEMHTRLMSEGLPGWGVPVQNARWTEEGFELAIQSGTIWLEAAVDGVRPGAYFEGQATVASRPKAAERRAA